jgi:hypothetical protein
MSNMSRWEVVWTARLGGEKVSYDDGTVRPVSLPRLRA